MKNFKWLLLFVIVFCCSFQLASQGKQSGIITPQNDQIINETKFLINDIYRNLNKLNVDSVFRDFDCKHFVAFFSQGRKSNCDSLVLIFRNVYNSIEKVNLEAINEQYTVLSPDVVLYTSGFKEKGQNKDGKEFKTKGVFTIILQKIDNKWKVIHGHQSFAW